MAARKLTAKQEAFALALVETNNQSEAYRRAYNVRPGTPIRTINEAAARLAAHSGIASRVRQLRDELAKKTMVTAAMVVDQWWKIATTDTNELVQLRRINCRHCWGVGHRYQWTAEQFAMACAEMIEKRRPCPDNSGGDGFDGNRPPHPDCPECHGNGDESVYLADTRKLTGGAKLLYAGVKQTKYGPEIIMRDQDDALRNIARFLGMFTEKVQLLTQQQVPSDVTLPTADPVEAAKVYARLMGGAT